MDCADSTLVVRPLFQEEGDGAIPISALQLIFSTTSEATFKEMNLKWHSRLPRVGASHFRVSYCAEFANRLYAVAAWSNPVARLLPQRTFLELRRMAIADNAPKNTASRMLGWMARDIRNRFPEVERLISYQDCETHKGTIYLASGWKHAEGYKGRKRGWESGTGGGRKRVGRLDQAVAVRMRWEKQLQRNKLK